MPTETYGKRSVRSATRAAPSKKPPLAKGPPGWTRRYTKVMVFVVIGIFGAHFAMRLILPSISAPQSAMQIATLSARDNLPAWSKIYPGAKDIQIEDRSSFGVRAWRVTYTVSASSDQVQAFYKQAADSSGFSPDNSALGMALHEYRQPSTDDNFSVDTSSGLSGTDVIYDPRSIDHSPSPSGK